MTTSQLLAEKWNSQVILNSKKLKIINVITRVTRLIITRDCPWEATAFVNTGYLIFFLLARWLSCLLFGQILLSLLRLGWILSVAYRSIITLWSHGSWTIQHIKQESAGYNLTLLDRTPLVTRCGPELQALSSNKHIRHIRYKQYLWTAFTLSFKALSFWALGIQELGHRESGPLHLDRVIKRLWLKMDFSFWSRLHCNYLPECKGTLCSRSSGDGFVGSAWWQRRATDYLFCFAFSFHARHLFGEQAVCHCRDDFNKGTSNPWALFCHPSSQPACRGPRNDIYGRSPGAEAHI